MRARRLLVHPGHAGGPQLAALCDGLHQVLGALNGDLSKSHDLNFLLGILARDQALLLRREQVVNFVPVDFHHADVHVDVQRVSVAHAEDVVCCQQVQTRLSHLWSSEHGESFPTARLSKGKASSKTSFHHEVHKRFGSRVVESEIVGLFVECMVETELVVFCVFGEIDLLFRFSHLDDAIIHNTNNIDFPIFCWPLPDDACHTILGRCVSCYT
mmetsp:Transcript_28681/g.92526  ORF Transcript_28681/g.92526 Transcript_28681/m.92526 type:complete len:214 (-) Transcript_28681:777-1418(-)